MTQHLHHFDLVVNNPSSSQAFYGALFNTWTFGTPGPNYLLIDPGKDPKGGMRPNFGGASRFIPMFWVDNINDALHRIDSSANAGTIGPIVGQPKAEHPSGFGMYVIIRDPDGIQIGLMEPSGASDAIHDGA